MVEREVVSESLALHVRREHRGKGRREEGQSRDSHSPIVKQGCCDALELLLGVDEESLMSKCG